MGDSLEEGEVQTFSLSEKFEELFPIYLVMGMTYELYWKSDPQLVKAYRKAYKLKQERKEYELWKQGMYYYEALIDVSPILHAFAKNGTKPRPYSSKPYGIEEYEKEIETKEDKQRKAENERLKARLHFMNLTRLLKKQFSKNGENNNGRNDN